MVEDVVITSEGSHHALPTRTVSEIQALDSTFQTARALKIDTHNPGIGFVEAGAEICTAGTTYTT